MDPKNILEGLSGISCVRTDPGGLSAFVGERNGNNVIVISKPTASKNIETLQDGQNLEQTFKNERFTKYEVTLQTRSELCVIEPALDNEVYKFRERRKVRIFHETPLDYKTEIEPNIRTDDLQWIRDIFSGKTTGSEQTQEEIIYQDEVFAILPDLKWDKKDTTAVYCLAIVRDSSLRSIRDLRRKHVKVLMHTHDRGKEAMVAKYGVTPDQIRVYFHYHPTYWWLHIHFNLVSNKTSGSSIDCAVPLVTVVNNLELMDDYYEKATLPVVRPNIFVGG